MKKHALLGTLALMAGSLIAADSGPKDDVKAAAGKLAAKSNYSWKTTVEAAGGGGRFRPGPTEGKTEKDGFTFLSMTRGDNTMEAVLKGGKGALKTPDGWKSLAEATEAGDGQPNPAQFIGRMLQNFKSPAAQAEDLAAKALRENPKSAAALEFDGRVKFYQGRYQEALKSLDEHRLGDFPADVSDDSAHGYSLSNWLVARKFRMTAVSRQPP